MTFINNTCLKKLCFAFIIISIGAIIIGWHTKYRKEMKYDGLCTESFSNMMSILRFSIQKKSVNLYDIYESEPKSFVTIYISPFIKKRSYDTDYSGTRLSRQEFNAILSYKVECANDKWTIYDIYYPLLKIEIMRHSPGLIPKTTPGYPNPFPGYTTTYYGVPLALRERTPWQDMDKSVFANEGLSYLEYKQYLKTQQVNLPKIK